MLIREANISDLDTVYTLICELENKEIPYNSFNAIYKENIVNNLIHYVVVEIDKHVVGFCSLHIQKLLHHSNSVSEIQELVIKKQYRGKGIGLKLINKAKEISLENGCELIEVCCNRKRTDSHKFYEKNGLNKSHYKFTLKW